MENMNIKKVIFCEIAWMKNYCGVTEEDKPVNVGKYINDNGRGGEIYNFAPHNHKCFGYVMHYGEELHIERYDKILKNHSEVTDMTVVWVATKGDKCKIVGWYEHATMYRSWQSFRDFIIGDEWYDYNFVADEKSCYLIPEEKRDFVIPGALKAGKGRGMGRSHVWYADSRYAQEEVVPEVLSYLDSVRDICTPIYYLPEEIERRADDKGDTTEALLDECEKAVKEGRYLDAMAVANLAVDKDDRYDTRLMRAEMFMSFLLYDEAEEEYKRALYHEENTNAMALLMDLEIVLEHTFLAIELGEKLRKRKEETEHWDGVASNLAYLYIGEGQLDAAEALIQECEEGSDSGNHEWIDEARKNMLNYKEQIGVRFPICGL